MGTTDPAGGGVGVGDGVGLGVGDGVGLGVGDGVGETDGVGDGVGLGVGDGVGVGVGLPPLLLYNDAATVVAQSWRSAPFPVSVSCTPSLETYVG